MTKTKYWTWNDVPAVMNLEQTSALLGLSVESVRRYCLIGDIPGIQIGRQWRVDKELLMKKFGHS